MSYNNNISFYDNFRAFCRDNATYDLYLYGDLFKMLPPAKWDKLFLMAMDEFVSLRLSYYSDLIDRRTQARTAIQDDEFNERLNDFR